MIYEFDDCTLDTERQELQRDGQLVAVEPQVFAVLEYLLANADRVVTKIELLDEVWGDRFVSESALTSRIKLARQACGDSGRAQQIIKTVHGRGYRVVSPIATGAPARPLRPTSVRTAIGRDHELGLIDAAASAAGEGRQVTTLVTGPAGAGKTTLVDDFLERSDDLDGWTILRGRCHRPRSGPEPYFALLDAIGGLAASEPDLVRDTLDRVAPSWLLQLSTLIDDEVASRLEHRLLGSARQRMLREGADAFAAIARRRPTAIVVEDLHLADDCTLDVLELVTGRQEPVPLLVLTTARLEGDALSTFVAEITKTDRTSLIELAPLDREAVAEMLADLHPDCSIDPELATLLHDRCDGNPLFARQLAAAWQQTGMIATDDGNLTVGATPDELLAAIPEGLVALIEHSLDGLDRDERAVLEAAAVAGQRFDAAAVAAGADLSVADAEEVLARMARRADHITVSGAAAWPDGTVSTAYSFAHQLYRDVVHDRIPAGRRAELHRRIGLAVEAGHLDDVGELAAALADHFTAAGDAARSARYLRLVGVQSIGRQAPGHAAEVLTDALDACRRLPSGTDRDATELAVRLSLGTALVGTNGWNDDGVRHTYERALDVARQLGAADEEANARYALATISEIHGDFERTEQLLMPLIATDNGGLEMEAHELVACSTFHQGAFERSEINSSAVLEEWPEDTPSELMAKVAEHPATSCNSWMSLSNWFMGRSEDSLRRAENAVRLAERHRYALATAMQQRAMLHQLRNEPAACLEWAERTTSLDRDLVSRVRVIQSDLLAGWARAVTDATTDALEPMADALGRLREAGVVLNSAYYVALFADANLHHLRVDVAVALLDEAEATIDETTRTYFHRSELARLRARAEFLLAGSDASSRARAELDRSLELAQAMGSPALALRTISDRLELETVDGDPAPFRASLAELVSRYDGQDEPPDVVRARGLLTPA